MARGWRFPGDRPLAGAVTPPRSRTVGDLLAEMAARRGGRPAFVFEGCDWPYDELRDRSRRVARGLLASGIGKGDHVALFMGNRPEWLVAWMAANSIGATIVGLSTWSAPAELAYLLRHSDARMLIHADRLGERDLVGRVEQCLAEAGWASQPCPALPALRSTVPLEVGGGAFALDELAARGEAVDDAVVDALGAEVRGSDVGLLLYTSGSTATPKGVQLTHRGMIENAYDIGEALQLGEQDRYWLGLPLFWSAGSANVSMSVLTHGACIVMQEFFHAPTAARLLRDERCTHYFGFPNVTSAIHAALGAARTLPAARCAVTPGQREAVRMLCEMGFSQLFHAYGATEDYGFATVNAPDEPLELLATRQGHPLPGIEVRIADLETGEPVEHGMAGEILLRGHVTPGYYKDEDKNQAALDEQGYFHTGDAGVLHQDGRLEFRGRIKELIKSSGMNVAPAEVEAVLLAHPAVAEAYVVGVPDPDRGAAVVAFTRLVAGAQSTDPVLEHCRRMLSSYKVPRRIVRCDEFPMTATGKVSKDMLVRSAEAS